MGNLSYSYDSAGRRMSVTGSLARTGLPLAISITAYNADNQLTTWGTANLSYDANENMTSDGTHSYIWDARNRLAKIDNGTTASFIYDPFGRRASKNILGASTSFLYDGANPVQELSGITPTANLLTGSLDEYFTRTDSSGARHFLTDALGSTLSLADSTGALQTSYTFDPFGSTTASGAGSTNSFAYTGRELDAGNLYFYRARYYNPVYQRFISEDPIGFLGGDVNLYGYVNNMPLNFRDNSGLDGFRSGGGGASGSWPCNTSTCGDPMQNHYNPVNSSGGGLPVGGGLAGRKPGGGGQRPPNQNPPTNNPPTCQDPDVMQQQALNSVLQNINSHMSFGGNISVGGGPSSLLPSIPVGPFQVSPGGGPMTPGTDLPSTAGWLYSGSNGYGVYSSTVNMYNQITNGFNNAANIASGNCGQ